MTNSNTSYINGMRLNNPHSLEFLIKNEKELIEITVITEQKETTIYVNGEHIITIGNAPESKITRCVIDDCEVYSGD